MFPASGSVMFSSSVRLLEVELFFCPHPSTFFYTDTTLIVNCHVFVDILFAIGCLIQNYVSSRNRRDQHPAIVHWYLVFSIEMKRENMHSRTGTLFQSPYSVCIHKHRPADLAHSWNMNNPQDACSEKNVRVKLKDCFYVPNSLLISLNKI